MKMIKIKLNVPTDSFISNLCCRCHKELKFTQIFGIGIDGYFCEICSNNECSSYTGKLIEQKNKERKIVSYNKKGYVPII